MIDGQTDDGHGSSAGYGPPSPTSTSAPQLEAIVHVAAVRLLDVYLLVLLMLLLLYMHVLHRLLGHQS